MLAPSLSTGVAPGGPAVTKTKIGDGDAVVKALRTVLLFTLTDVFALVPEESMWVGYHLDQALAPLRTLTPSRIPLPVQQELSQARPYSRALDRLERFPGQGVHPVFDPGAAHASELDWAAVFMHMVTSAFHVRPMDEAVMNGRFVGVLRELGVGHPVTPRGAKYLPNDVRWRLNHA